MIVLVVDFLLLIIKMLMNFVSNLELNFGFGRILWGLIWWWCGIVNILFIYI